MLTHRVTALLAATLAVSGCQTASIDAPSTQRSSGASALRLDDVSWSEPVVVAPGIISLSTSNEQGPALSPDGLALYFCSNRTPSRGNDLWVSRRASENAPWEAPVQLSDVVNSPAGDCGPSLSQDGHLLFFTSARAGGAGGNDIYMSSRENVDDDAGWGTPVRLGPEINTAQFEFSPVITRWRDAECDETGCEPAWAELYFERGAASGGPTDIQVAWVTPSGEALGPAMPVTELNSPDADMHATVRFDGREVLLSSNRDGRGGNFDLFVATRQSPNHPWSTPELITELSISGRHEIHPSLSRDGRSIYFVRGTGTANDIYVASRTPSGH